MNYKKIVFAGIIGLLMLAGCGTKGSNTTAKDESKS